LASLDNSNLEAQLQGAQADVMAAQANLATLQNGATSQTLAVYNQAFPQLIVYQLHESHELKSMAVETP